MSTDFIYYSKRSDVKSSGGKAASYSDKVKFSQLVNRLSSPQLGKVVEMLQTRCPAALNDDDEVDLEIEVDAIDKATLVLLIEYAEECVVKTE